MTKILVIDDEASIRRTLKEILEFEKYSVEVAEDGKSALEYISDSVFDVVLCDIKMPKMDGVEVLSEINKITNIPVIMISGHGDIETAVSCIKNGAFDYIQKPIDLSRLLVSVKNALDKNNLIREAKILKKKVSDKYEMIGEKS